MKTKSNMYDWVDLTWCPLWGECPHQCSYCYVKSFHRLGDRYKGPLRLDPKLSQKKLGKNKTWFVCHMNDLFADKVPDEFILAVLEHCCKWPQNTYVFQSKNPVKYQWFLDNMPPNRLLGTTIETTNDLTLQSESPSYWARYIVMTRLARREPTFVTLEPLLDFDMGMMMTWLTQIAPRFVNIGADSKGQPSAGKIRALIAGLEMAGIKVNQKPNLKRLLP